MQSGTIGGGGASGRLLFAEGAFKGSVVGIIAVG